jgi:hypothetical protein
MLGEVKMRQSQYEEADEMLLVDPTHARKLTGHQSEKAFRRYTLRSEQEAAIAAWNDNASPVKHKLFRLFRASIIVKYLKGHYS